MHELPLGKSVEYDAPYDPKLLFSIPRAPGREQLGLNGAPPFNGCDIWNAYEMSWLDVSGKPQVAWGEFRIPADSPNIVESKSFKVYLNSFNQHRFESVDSVVATLQRDLSAALCSPLEVDVRLPEQWCALQCVEPEGLCLDDLPIAVEHYLPVPELLRAGGRQVSQTLFSRLLRSRCPVTGQPDWATVQIAYTGPEIDAANLLAYIVSFRLHQDFHEHCVERIFCDILLRCAPTDLTVYARYLRRGGLDINPYRSTASVRAPNGRLAQQ